MLESATIPSLWTMLTLNVAFSRGSSKQGKAVLAKIVSKCVVISFLFEQSLVSTIKKYCHMWLDKGHNQIYTSRLPGDFCSIDNIGVIVVDKTNSGGTEYGNSELSNTEDVVSVVLQWFR